MKAIIMAAGEGKRMGDLTRYIPKPMLPIGETPLLNIKLSQMEGLISEALIVVNYMKDYFIDFYRAHFTQEDGAAQYRQKGWKSGITISFVEQGQLKGTAKAVEGCKPLIGQEDFLVMNGDNFYGRASIEAIIEAGPNSIAVAELIPGLEPKAIAETRDGQIIAIHEKLPLLASIGIYHFNEAVFEHLAAVKESPRGEYEITDAISSLAKSTAVRAVLVERHIEITTPDDLKKAEVTLREWGVLK